MPRDGGSVGADETVTIDKESGLLRQRKDAMVVFIIAGVLILWNAFVGFGRGAIRSIANLAGLAGAVLLSPKLADVFQPLVVRYLTQNPVWERTASVGMAAIAIWLFFTISGRIMHRVAFGSAGDARFGLNKKLGLFIGFAQGLAVAFIFLWAVYFLGTVAWLFSPLARDRGVAAPAGGTFADYVIAGRSQLTGRNSLAPTKVSTVSPLEGVLIQVDPVPKKFYDATALLGILANEPEKRALLRTYPGYLRLEHCKAIHEAITDPDLNKLAAEGKPLSVFLYQPKVVAILQDKESNDALENFDWSGALKFVGARGVIKR